MDGTHSTKNKTDVSRGVINDKRDNDRYIYQHRTPSDTIMNAHEECEQRQRREEKNREEDLM
jgi:hypothetical protein